MDAAIDVLKQYILANKALNPSVQDICRLFQTWREKNYGADDGRPLFERLQAEVDKKYLLDKMGSLFCSGMNHTSNTTQQRKTVMMKYLHHLLKRDLTSKPLILALCIPLTARVHKHVCQAGELLFCDSTSSMDRFNTSILLLSTHSAASGIPLGVILTSDEREETIQAGLQLLRSILPNCAFPRMINDSSAERGAISKCWPQSHILLCTFHFLQRQ